MRACLTAVLLDVHRRVRLRHLFIATRRVTDDDVALFVDPVTVTTVAGTGAALQVQARRVGERHRIVVAVRIPVHLLRIRRVRQEPAEQSFNRVRTQNVVAELEALTAD